ncbi:MAG: NAD(P)H-dependent oxidoreductase [Rhizobiales bacterium]|nr:NAD(P)H-dependent oxidoreductase [Hyphomicrobiales bacterium]
MTAFKSKFKLGLIVGSNRRQSINRALAQALAKLGGSAFDAKFIQIDDLPMYNQDLEAALPDSVTRFKAEVESSDAILFVTPEHSRSIPAVLKNAIDWGTRPWGKNSWTGKTAAVTGTSQGAVATAVAQQHLRAILGDIGMVVMGGEAYIGFKPGLVDEQHAIADDSVRKFLQAFVDQLAVLTGKLSAKIAPRAAA